MATEESRRRILRLPDDVIGKIAAGEVVTRPNAAVKELLENALDAGATSVTVTVRGGGLKTLMVVDNGCGVERDDFPLLCERFATSKIRCHEDLTSVSSFGFRGEALASLAQVARVTVSSMRKDASLAYKAEFQDGRMLPGFPVPCAGVPGTVVQVDSLFYNLPIRQRALSNSAEEYRAIVDLFNRYSIRYSGVSMTCRKLAEDDTRRTSIPDVKTSVGASELENIRGAFGSSLSAELVPLDFELESLKIRTHGHISNSSLHLKKGIFICFVNGRLVDCQPIKRSMDSVYSGILPRGAHPFVYLDISMEPSNLDVNVHPSKREVRFLHSEKIIERLASDAAVALKGAGQSRVFYAQMRLSTGELNPILERHREAEQNQKLHLTKEDNQGHRNAERPDGDIQFGTRNLVDPLRPAPSTPTPLERTQKTRNDASPRLVSNKRKNSVSETGEPSNDPTVETPERNSVHRQSDRDKMRVLSYNKIRTSLANEGGGLDAFVKRKGPKSVVGDEQGGTMTDDPKDPVGIVARPTRRPNAPPLLTSVQEIAASLIKEADSGLGDLFCHCTLVGVADVQHILVQYKTELVLVNSEAVLSAAMRQIICTKFADFEEVPIVPPAPIRTLVRALLETKSGPPLDSRAKEKLAQDISDKLSQNNAMLREYFALSIDSTDEEDPKLTGLPMLLRGLQPDLRLLPELLHGLGILESWAEEKPCLEGIISVLATFFGSWGGPGRSANQEHETARFREREHNFRHVLLPCLRRDFFPPKSLLLRGHVREVASLPQLYRVFERC
mmetsp:Transcript_8137/g.16405  ORF Transcript_8137/g.16405 Transcript_8137/m.16405 type:complete len:787 (-) Transcript_8137:1060-3420(-)